MVEDIAALEFEDLIDNQTPFDPTNMEEPYRKAPTFTARRGAGSGNFFNTNQQNLGRSISRSTVSPAVAELLDFHSLIFRYLLALPIPMQAIMTADADGIFGLAIPGRHIGRDGNRRVVRPTFEEPIINATMQIG
ncbi:Uncharacterised protein [BD1-7 clade bacterium]|uniref:Uncharacterized protein n=1 Tax=BD1-7 clade bacterium TaxID=2029982 RepID=A0A5S9NJP1_9GAMM|nr:Uncharacterised protein [BD1-7 clade bacterium]CAA0093493.1 Uncharacterised protein [BD1-7 clade bacterium]